MAILLKKMSEDEQGQTRLLSKENKRVNGQTEAAKTPPKPTSDGGAPDLDWSDDDFDPTDPPPFGYSELRAAVPKHCFERDAWRSLRYAGVDAAAIVALAVAAVYFDSWLFWPFYWIAQGQMFWAMFYVGHDCGHGAFSENTTLNTVVGCFVHTLILIPYHSWKFTHRSHHKNQGHADKDETWVPVTESTYRDLQYFTRLFRFTVPFNLFMFPFYLIFGKLGTMRSHFNPYCKLFQPLERKFVIESNVWWLAMASLLVWGSFTYGVTLILKIYLGPYLVLLMWLGTITYLQHHGHDDQLPWYRGKEWNYLRGGLSTVDLDYGCFNDILHNAGAHVIHHIFPRIPHYHLVEATEAIKPVLGKYYREPEKSGRFPFHIIKLLVRSINRDHYVSDTGDILYYQTDHELHNFFGWCKSK